MRRILSFQRLASVALLVQMQKGPFMGHILVPCNGFENMKKKKIGAYECLQMAKNNLAGKII